MITVDTFKRGLSNGFKTLFNLLKFMIPVYIAVQLMSLSGILNVIADFCAPVMSYLGLPGEASLTIIVGYFTGIYPALGTMAAIKLSAVQATTLAIMISIAHNLINEAVVIQKLKVNAFLCASVRVVVSIACGLLYCHLFG